MEAYIFAFLVLFIAAGIQGMTGIGYSMISTALLPLMFPFKEAFVSISGFCVLSALYIVITEWKYIRFRILPPVLLGTLSGATLGTYVFLRLDPNTLALIFGIVLVAISVFVLRNDGHYRVTPKFYMGIGAGFISGLADGACNMPGPPLAAYYSNVFPDDKSKYYATTTATFFITGTYRIILLISNGLITENNVGHIIAVLIPSIIGFGVGRSLFRKVDSKRIFRLVYIIMIGIGAWLIASKLFTIWNGAGI